MLWKLPDTIYHAITFYKKDLKETNESLQNICLCSQTCQVYHCWAQLFSSIIHFQIQELKNPHICSILLYTVYLIYTKSYTSFKNDMNSPLAHYKTIFFCNSFFYCYIVYTELYLNTNTQLSVVEIQLILTSNKIVYFV